MALMGCRECGARISTQARACPQCGAPAQGSGEVPRRRGMLEIVLISLGALFVVLATFALSMVISQSPGDDVQAESRDSPRCQSDDLTCRGKQGMAAAMIDCSPLISGLAKHGFEWLPGDLFSGFRWANAQHDVIEYVGDQARMEVSPGYYWQINYTCAFDVARGSALNASYKLIGFPAAR